MLARLVLDAHCGNVHAAYGVAIPGSPPMETSPEAPPPESSPESSETVPPPPAASTSHGMVLRQPEYVAYESYDLLIIAMLISPCSVAEAALLKLKSLVEKVDVDPMMSSIFGSWVPGVDPCYSSTCQPCRLSDAACGVYQASLGANLCVWRYIQCTDDAVTGINFGEEINDMSALIFTQSACSLSHNWCVLTHCRLLESKRICWACNCVH
jgi:hypothetical protein